MRDRLDGICTREGRVVYDRKPHYFTTKDIKRIIEKLGLRQDELFDDDGIDSLENLVDTGREILELAVKVSTRTASPVDVIDLAAQVAKMLSGVMYESWSALEILIPDLPIAGLLGD